MEVYQKVILQNFRRRAKPNEGHIQSFALVNEQSLFVDITQSVEYYGEETHQN